MQIAYPPRITHRFNDDCRFHLGDFPGASEPVFDAADWRVLRLPHDGSIEGPFDSRWASATGYLPGGIGWYRKTFTLPDRMADKQVSRLWNMI